MFIVLALYKNNKIHYIKWSLYYSANNIHKKKLLNSDWLRKESSSPVTRVQITNGFWLAENTKETNENQSD